MRKASDGFFGGVNPAATADDYLQKSGVDLITDPKAIRDVRSYYESKGETFSSDSEMWDNFYSDRRWRSTNSLSMAKGAAEYALAGSSQDLHARLSKIWTNAPSRGGMFDKVVDYGLAGALDPLNLLAGAGVAKKAQTAYSAARAGMATSQQAIKAGTRAGAVQGAKTEAMLNAGIGGAFDAAQQATEIQQGVSDEFSLGRVAASSALDATIGGAFGAVFGGYQGKKAATNVTNWRGTTAVGNDITRRTQRLDADIRTANEEYNAAAEAGEDSSAIFEQLRDLQDERKMVGEVEKTFDGFDTELDDLARRAQTATSENPDADVRALQDDYQNILAKRGEAFSKPVDTMIDDMMGARPARAPEAEAPELEAPKAEAPEVAAPKAVAPAANAETVAVNADDVAADTASNTSDVAADIASETEELPEVKYGKNNGQLETLVAEGKVTVDEVGRLISDGTLIRNKDGSIKARYGNKVTATTKVKEYIKKRDAGAAPEATVAAPAAAPKTSTPKSAVEEAIVERPAQDYEAMADKEFSKFYDEFLGADGPWSQKVPRILGAAKRAMDGQVYRRFADRFKAVLELEKMGKTAPNADEVAALRAQFLEREGQTAPDVGDSTTPRSADRAAVAAELLENGPKTAGLGSNGRVQPILRDGYSTGSADGRTVTSIADVPDLQSLTEKGAEAVKARAAMERAQGKEKAMYVFEASGRERKGSIADGQSLSKGAAAWYVPNAKKYFTSEKNARKAAGLQGDDNFDVVARTATKTDKPIVLTDEHYAREKNSIDAKFFSDENMTAEEHSSLISELDQRTAGRSTEEPKAAAPKANALPDVAGERNGKVIAAIPRDPNGKFKSARILNASQQADGLGLNAILGKSPREEWFIGYVDTSMRNKRSAIERLKRELDPIDEGNATGVERAVEAEDVSVNAPVDQGSADWTDDNNGIDLATLTKEERTGLYLAIKMSDTLTVGTSVRTGRVIQLGDVYTLENLKEGKFSLEDLDDIAFSADNFPLRGKITLNGQEVDPGEDARMLALKTVFDLRRQLAPNGIRRPMAQIEDSLATLNTKFDTYSVKDRKQIARMFEMVSDEKGQGPRVGAMSIEEADGALGRYDPRENAIELTNEDFTNDVGGSPTFVAAHELGHWVYRNLMADEDIMQFWGALRGQVLEGKTLTNEGFDLMVSRQPWGKDQSDFDRPNEYFANQFALYLNRRHDMMMWPDKSFWDKVSNLAKKVFERLSGKGTYDTKLEPLFHKLITRQEEKTRVNYANTVEPKTSLGKIIQVRYAILGDKAREATSRLDLDDIENFAFSMNGIADEFNSMATTEKGAKIIASRKGEPYNASYTGVLEAIKPLAPRMRKAARLIKSVTGRYDQNINQSGADEISGSAFFADMEEDLKLVIGEESMLNLIDDVLEKLNEAYQAVEFGDVPEYAMTRETADLRRRVGMSKIAKSMTMKKSLRAFKAEKARNKSYATKMVEDAKKKSNPNAKAANDDAPKINPGEVDIVTASREFQKQIDEKGNLTKLGKALSRRVAHILNTEGVLPYRRRSYSDLNNAELFLRYGQAVESGNQDLLEKLAFEIQVRNVPMEIENSGVSFAIQAEQDLRVGVPSETGIPSNANYMMRNALRAITHRTEPETHAARTMATRLGLLGHDFNADISTDRFKQFRKEMRQLASNVTKTADISQTIRGLTRRIISSKAVSEEGMNDIRRVAAEFGYDADDFIINVVLDDVDTSKKTSYTSDILAQIRSQRGNELDDVIASGRANVREALGYVLNGLVSNKATRRRFLPLFTFGDLSATVSRFDAAAPISRFTDEVPAEFAEEFSSDVISSMSPASRSAADKFTGGNLTPYYSGSSPDTRLDGMAFVTRRPENTIKSEAGNITTQSETPEKMSEVLEALAATRNNINEMRVRGDTDPQRIEAMYVRERVMRKEVELLGSIDTSMTTPVFIRDDKPLNLKSKNTLKSPDIAEVISLIKSSENPAMKSPSASLDGMLGVFSSEQVFDMLSNAAGGARKLRALLREAGFTSLNLPGRKAILKDEYMKPIRSNMFEDSNTSLAGTIEAASDINANLILAMSQRSDMGSMAWEQSAMALELGGVRKATVDVLSKVRRGSTINEQDGMELRKSFRHNLLNSNAQILRKSGMPTLADFFEPSKGGGGHFERVSANMGRFVIPLTRKLRGLPDSGNFLKRWVDNGIGQMYGAAADSGRKILHMAPIHRGQQPTSHIEILGALRDSSRAGRLTTVELETHDYIKSYLEDALTRLRKLGQPVGEIMDNYFPQIWRKDLIEADQQRFTDLLQKYFIAEAKQDGYQTTKEAALAKAIKVKNRLIATDGADSSDALGEYKISADTDDSFDFQRQIRLDKFPQFMNPTDPDSNISAFLENDLLAVLTKYSDSLEQRLDLHKGFGPKAIGYHDYLIVQDQGLDGVTKLLSTGRVISRDHASNLTSGERVRENRKTVMFHPPFADEIAAQTFVKELAGKARRGASKAELQQSLMARLDTSGEISDEAARMRKNFAHRAKAIASALHDSNGFLNEKGQIVQVDKKNILHAEGFFRATLRKDIEPSAGKVVDMKAASKFLRSINAVTLLGFTTLSSLGDLVLPTIRTGDFMATMKAWKGFMQDPVSGSVYRDMIRNVGAASENIVHQRMTKAFGVDNTKFTSGFFTGTLLTPWTDMNRDLAAAVGYEHFRAQARIAYDAPGTKQGRIAKRILDEAGLSDVYRTNMNLEAVLRSSEMGDEHPYREVLTASIIKIANESIFTPNANDIPLMGQTPTGMILMQLKSFPLMMTRLGRTVWKEAVDNGDTRRVAPLLYMAGLGPLFGSGVAFAKDVVQGRGGEDNREFAPRERALTDKWSLAEEFGLSENADKLGGWYIDGLMQMGGLGLIGQMMYDSAAQLDNGAYGQQRINEMVFGPTMGLFNDAKTVASGVFDRGRDAVGADTTNAKERAMYRELLGRVPVLGGSTPFREGLTDLLGGKQGN